METYLIRIYELELHYTGDDAPPQSHGFPNEKYTTKSEILPLKIVGMHVVETPKTIQAILEQYLCWSTWNRW